MKQRKTLKEIVNYHSRKLDEMNKWGFIEVFESGLLDDLEDYIKEREKENE